MAEPDPKLTDAERQASELAAMLDEAADDFERNGPVPVENLLRKLSALHAEPAAKEQPAE